MRNKLPILLALLLMAAAATPWLRSLESQRWISGGPTTVPPPTASLPGAALPVANAPQSAPDTMPPKIGTTSSPTEPAQAAQPKPQSLIDNAVLAVENQQRISAQITEDGELFGHPMVGAGRYYEVRQGPIPMIHLELTIQVDAVTTSLVQVCNGTTFWTYRKLPNGEMLSKLDAVRAITALEQAAGRLPPGQINASPGLGGLGRLIRGLNSQFDFAAAVPDEVDGAPAWKLAGVWKPNVLGRLLPDQKDNFVKGHPFDTSRLPAHLPDGVTIYLRQSDYFPLRIDYCRNVAKTLRSLLSLKFSDVNFTSPVDSSQFLFTPGSLEYNDRTDDFVRSLGG